MHPNAFYRDFFRERPPLPNAGQCFVAMPFASRFDPVYAAIKTACEAEDLGFRCRRADETAGGGIIMESVLEDIKDAEAVIFDLSSKRANVFFELGIASTIKSARSIILISREKPPFDVEAYRYFRYRTEALDLLRQYLDSALREMTPARKKITIRKGATYRSESNIRGESEMLYGLSLEVIDVGEDAAMVQIDVWPVTRRDQRNPETKLLRLFNTERIPRTNYALKLHAASAEGIEVCICDPNPAAD